MRCAPILALVLSPALAAAQREGVPFTPGMIITTSARIAPGNYPAPAGEGPLITVRGAGITLDLRGVELRGGADPKRPDLFHGTAILIDGGRDITVRGGTVRGYRVALHARDTDTLRLLDLTLSHNAKPRLYSGIVKESLIDWISYHQNEHGEWLRKGAAIYLDGVTGGEIRNLTAQQGLNGLLMNRTTGMKVWNSDFSFNSGVGIGMYRSSHNVVMHNRIDYNVRGFSHGFYNRGQDSAGLLMYEQSSNNVVAFNSVTHSGDGLFLWAGQSTMDTGVGGANDNLFYGNDFSHAPTNGIEATFSRNVFAGNRIEENWHGVWGGYSYNSVWSHNQFRDNDVAVAIEHGQENRIVGNEFSGDTTGVRLWWNRVEPGDWGYPKARDTRSRDAVILGNEFSDVGTAIRLDNSQGTRIVGNRFIGVDTVLSASGDTAGTVRVPSDGRRIAPSEIPPEFVVKPLRGGNDAMIPVGAPRGRATIIVDQWGPYDWQSPKLWPVGRADAVPQRLRVLGPAGDWRVVELEGVVSLSAERGKVGDTLTVVPTGGRESDWRVELEYTGDRQFVTRFGDTVAAGTPYRFEWSRFEPETLWHLRFTPWDTTNTSTIVTSAAVVATIDTTRLDLTWYAPSKQEIPQANLFTEATAVFKLEPGEYLLRTIADDAVRVWLNGKLVIDDWKAGESHLALAKFTATAADSVRVLHLQKDGWYELRLDIEHVQ